MAEVAATRIESKAGPPSEEVFIHEVDNGIAYFLDRTDHELGPNSPNPQVYHLKDHPIIVIDRVERLGRKVMEIAPEILTVRQFHRARLDAGTHDIKQAFDSNEDVGTIKEKRVRHRGPNEKNSGDQLVNYMEDKNKKSVEEGGSEVFTDDDIAQVGPTMKGTEPGWDQERQTVAQPFINSESPIEAKLVGLADLGGAGMDGAEQYVKEGNSEFLEVRIGITRALTNAMNDLRGLDSLSLEDKKYIGSEIKNWLRSQIAFVQGRQFYLDQDLSHFNNPELAEVLKREEFNKFDESIEAAKTRAELADSLDDIHDLPQLVELIGFKDLVLKRAA